MIAAAYAARGIELPFSMGLRPRQSADAALAARLEPPGWRPGDCHLKILSPGSVVILGRAAKPRLAWFPRRNVSYRLPFRAASLRQHLAPGVSPGSCGLCAARSRVGGDFVAPSRNALPLQNDANPHFSPKVGNVGSQSTNDKEISTKGHEGPRRDTKKNQKKDEFLRHQAVAAGTMALKLQRFTVTLCAHRFCPNNLINFFTICYQIQRTDAPTCGEKCGLNTTLTPALFSRVQPPVRNAG